MNRWPVETVVLCVAMQLACDPGVQTVDCAQDPAYCADAANTAGRLYVDPPFGLSFECVTIGCDTKKTLVLENRGDLTLFLTDARLDAGSSDDFSTQLQMEREDGSVLVPQTPTRDTPLTIAGHTRLTMQVRYTPSDARMDAGTMVFEYSDPTGNEEKTSFVRVTISLQARILGEARAALRTDSINFGQVSVFERAESFVDIENIAEGTAVLAIVEAKLDETSDDAFSLGMGWEAFANPGDRVRIPVWFSPRSEGDFFAAVTFATNDPSQTDLHVTLRGFSVDVPTMALSGEMVSGDFGEVRVGASKRLTVTVNNHGGGSIVLQPMFTAETTAFRIVPPEAGFSPIPPFEDENFVVEAAPEAAGDATTELEIRASDAAYKALRLPLHVLGAAPELVPSTAEIDFGNLVQGWTGEPQTLVLRNGGTGTLRINGIALGLGSSRQIHLGELPTLPAMLLPVDPPLEISLYLQAESLGTIEGSLIIDSDDMRASPQTIALHGQVVSCEEDCAFVHGISSCSSGQCALVGCEAGWHDTDVSSDNGCECREERSGSDVGGTCTTGVDLGQVGDDCSSHPSHLEWTANLHDLDDVDLYFIRNDDANSVGCDVFSDSSAIEVSLKAGPPNLLLCARIGEKGSGCGGYTDAFDPRYCGADKVRREGSYGQDDDQEMTVWVMWHPDAQPVCDSYTLRFSGK